MTTRTRVYHKRRHYCTADTAALYRVCTVAEAAERWGKTHHAIWSAVDDGRLNARQSGTIWLVSVASLKNLYGEPVHG